MRRYLLPVSAAILLLTAACVQAAVIDHTAVTITYDDTETFGSLRSDFGSPPGGASYGDILFNSLPGLEAASGQSLSATSILTLTIKAKPGYGLTSANFYENGNWATAKSGTVDVTGQDTMFDVATGNPIAGYPFAYKDTSPIGTALTAGSWSFSDGFSAFNSAPQKEVTFNLSRTLFVNGGLDGNAIIGNGSYSALSFYYTAQFVPEPATYAALALGFVVLSGMLRKRR